MNGGEHKIQPVSSSEQNKDTGIPLQQAMRSAVVEFGNKTSENELPDKVIYLLNPEQKTLVMLRRNINEHRPYSVNDLFAEVYELADDGKATYGYTKPELPSGNFLRVEVTDRYNDPLNKDGSRLVPTQFPESLDNLFYQEMKKNTSQKILADVSDKNLGPLGNIFLQQGIEATKAQAEQISSLGLTAQLAERYFCPDSTSSISEENSENFLILSGDVKNSLVYKILCELGMKDRTKIVKIRTDNDRGVIVGNNTDKSLPDSILDGDKPPLVIIGESFNNDDLDLPRALEWAIDIYTSKRNKHPLFSFINIDQQYYMSDGARFKYNKYQISTKNPDNVKNLIHKVGVDYFLTKKLRDEYNKLFKRFY